MSGKKNIRIEKVVSSLPGTLQADTVYFVKNSSVCDLYITNGVGTIVAYPISKPIAAPNILGNVIVGSNINVASDGTISVPIATETIPGVVKVGDRLTINNGVLNFLVNSTANYQQLSTYISYNDTVLKNEYSSTERSLIYQGRLILQSTGRGVDLNPSANYHQFSGSNNSKVILRSNSSGLSNNFIETHYPVINTTHRILKITSYDGDSGSINLASIDWTNGSGLTLNEIAGNSILFQFNGNEVARIASTGTITTNNATIYLRRNLTDYAARRNWGFSTEQNATGDFQILESSTNTGIPINARFAILSGGNTGIGDLFPTQRLQVAGSVRITSNSNTLTELGVQLDFYNTESTARLASYKSTGADLDFYITNTSGSLVQLLHLDKAGQVGIGTSIPNAKFVVSGVAARLAIDYQNTGDCYLDNRTTYFRTFSGTNIAYLDTSSKLFYLQGSIKIHSLTKTTTQYLLFDNRDVNTNHTDTYNLGGIIASGWRDVANPSNIGSIIFQRVSTVGGLSSGCNILFGTNFNGETSIPPTRLTIDYIGNSTFSGDVYIAKNAAYLILNGLNSDAEIYWQTNGSNRWALGMNIGDTSENWNLYNYTTASVILSVNKISGALTVFKSIYSVENNYLWGLLQHNFELRPWACDANYFSFNASWVGFSYGVNCPAIGTIASFSTSAGYALQLQTGYGFSDRFYLRARNGDIGMDQSSGWYAWYSVSITSVSDERLKENWTTLKNPLANLLSLKAGRFNYNQLALSKGIAASPNGEIGFAAQDFKEFLPEVLSDSGIKIDDNNLQSEKYYQLHYEKVTVLIVAAFQEYVEKTEQRIKELEQKNQSILSKLFNFKKLW